ncbi:protein FAM83A-like [Acipenser oxyrinchus oxyrinchus]|uniref:Protein FAM83A-like n=1 Tax=Acipenser oxyrinchus oxyrinchus TaxID=40147 RepID=A0AAD8CUZ1_ACIOX|nr:protein FAM83A-like [Acipenser oxyrinchus oxyrinchus]
MTSSDALRPTSTNSGRKPLGKLAARLEDVKNPWRQGMTLELSHNEAARLATDALLDSGELEYKRVVDEERELSFLSALDIKYIVESASKNSSADSGSVAGSGGELCGEGYAVSELTSGTYFPMMSDEEPPALELGWPEMTDQLPKYGPSETQIFFQRDKTHNMKDVIRSLINKAKKVIALVMDLFTDVDLFCDLLEAANKRKVPVYILLDEKNLKYFTEMCNTLDIQTIHISNMRVRSVCGDTYCTKHGKKFTGQVLEKFLIIDCEEVIAGSYSFTWLSSQVHSNMLMHFTGRIVESFDREFRCLYADSQIVDSLHDPDEDGIPCYSFGKHLPEFMQEKPKERVYSDPSSSCSSNSFSSIKKSPGMGSPAYKLNYRNAYLSPDKKAPSPGLYNPSNQGRKGSGSSGAVEQSSSDSQAFNPSALRNGGGAVSRISGLGLYETKQNYTPLNPSLGKEQRSPPYAEPEQPGKPKTAPLFSKLTNVLTPGAKEGFTKPPTRNNAAVVSHFKDLSLSESTKTNENKPGYPVVPAPLPADVLPAVRRGEISRHDVKRMTLGHSQLDLVNHYNKMKSKNIYSRFEVKDTPHM